MIRITRLHFILCTRTHEENEFLNRPKTLYVPPLAFFPFWSVNNKNIHQPTTGLAVSFFPVTECFVSPLELINEATEPAIIIVLNAFPEASISLTSTSAKPAGTWDISICG
jgi:hypothetical protein